MASSAEDDDLFSLRWNDYQPAIASAFKLLRANEEFVDVTLACEGKRLPSHRMLLSACSPHFRELLRANPCQHPIIIMRETKYEDLKSILEFMYQGEVSIQQGKLDSFLKTAETLRICGLTQYSDSSITNDDCTAINSIKHEVIKHENLTSSYASVQNEAGPSSGKRRRCLSASEDQKVNQKSEKLSQYNEEFIDEDRNDAGAQMKDDDCIMPGLGTMMVEANYGEDSELYDESYGEEIGHSLDDSVTQEQFEKHSEARDVRLFTALERIRQEQSYQRKLTEDILITLTKAPNEDGSSLLVPFPIMTEDDMQAIETKLNNHITFQYAIDMLSTIGGRNTEDYVHRLLSYCVSKNLTQKYNWFGRKGKKEFRRLRFASVLINVVQKNIVGATQESIQQAAIEWFRHVSDRDDNIERRKTQIKASTSKAETAFPKLADGDSVERKRRLARERQRKRRARLTQQIMEANRNKVCGCEREYK